MHKRIGMLVCLLLALSMPVAAETAQVTPTTPTTPTVAEPSQLALPAAVTRLKQVDCWFGKLAAGLTPQCYELTVPENYQKLAGRMIQFPVIVFRNPQPVAGQAPVLHLGAGGPGAAMYLDSAFAVSAVRDEAGAVWLEQGRDLVVIDPRGAGLARPLLNCKPIAQHIIADLRENLSLREQFSRLESYYQTCIQQFQQQGIELGAYHSLAVAYDVEQLRQALGIRQWVLYGISYATSYAQLVASTFPDTVAAMILDSSTFPNVLPHHNFMANTLAPYQALYDYCSHHPDCAKPLPQVEQRIWALYDQLTAKPLPVKVPDPRDDSQHIVLPLNGSLFLDSLVYGLYGTAIFARLPRIITGLEKSDPAALLDDLGWYLDYLLDEGYADISALTHYCYDKDAFTDYQSITDHIPELPAGYIRETAVFTTDWRSICAQLRTESPDPRVVQTGRTRIPTLFLHGSLDTVTPLRDVKAQLPNFSRSQLLIFPLSHGILGVAECADEAAAAFLLNPEAELQQLAQSCAE